MNDQMPSASARLSVTVLVVDDSTFMRRALTRMLDSAPDVCVVAQARNGRQAVELAQRHKPDVITMDIEMPEMDGLTALRQIMRQCPTHVLMVSSLTTEGSRAAIRAMQLGAADVMAKESSQISLAIGGIEAELLAKVRALGQAPRTRQQPGPATSPLPRFRVGQFDLLCIGSSTGGPPVLETLIRSVPQQMRLPIVIAQHMPRMFTESMAERLDGLCPLPVQLADDGMSLSRGHVYVAPGGQHTRVVKTGLAQWTLRVGDEPRQALYKPSVDVLIDSAAEAMGPRTLAIILTGMGNDGYQGARKLRARGGTVLAQDQGSCVVYGMPKAVTEQGIAAASLNPQQLASVIAHLNERQPATRPVVSRLQ